MIPPERFLSFFASSLSIIFCLFLDIIAKGLLSIRFSESSRFLRISFESISFVADALRLVLLTANHEACKINL
jgi:hypothetical protein